LPSSHIRNVVIAIPFRLGFGCVGRSRLSSQCLQHPLFLDALQAPLQKIDLQGLLANLALQFGDLSFIPAPYAGPRKRIPWAFAEFLLPSVQRVRVHFKGPCYFRRRGTILQPPDGGSFHFTRERSSGNTHESNSPFIEF
jgi:hypothetical protein